MKGETRFIVNFNIIQEYAQMTCRIIGIDRVDLVISEIGGAGRESIFT